MSIIRSWSGNGLQPGALTTDSAGPGDTPFTRVQGPVTIESGGERSPRIRLADTAEVKRVHWWPLPNAPLTSYAVRCYITFGAIPTELAHLISAPGPGADQWSIRINASGMLVVRDDAAGVVRWVATQPTPVGQAVRIEAIIDDGQLEMRAYEGETDTVISASPSVAVGTNVDELRFGFSTSVASASVTYDDMALSDEAEWIGAVDPTPGGGDPDPDPDPDPEPSEGVLLSWSGNGLPTGALTTTSAGTGDTAFSYVEGSLTVENSGPRAPRIRLPDAAQVKRVHWWPLPEGPHSEYAVRFYVSYGSIPGSSQTHIMAALNSGADQWSLRLNATTGYLTIRNDVSGANLWTGSQPVPVGRPVRIETVVKNNAVQVRAYEGDTAVVISESTNVAVNSEIDEVRFGLYTSTATNNVTFDDLAVSAIPEWIGPAYSADSNVFVRANGDWKRAETFIRVDGSWLPSESGDDGSGGGPLPAGWRLLYDSDFSSNDGWQARQETQSNDNSYNHPDNVEYESRGMVIHGRRENRGGRSYTSGDVTGQHIAVPNYFRAEVTATLPTESGMWPCPLWFRPLSHGDDGEIDVCETWPYDWGSNPRMYSTIWENYDTKRKENAGLSYSSLSNSDPAASHTYTVEKTHRRMRFECDGVLIYEWNDSNFNPTLRSWYDSIYEIPGRTWYPRMTLQIGAGNQGTAGNNAEPDPDWQHSEVVIHKLKIYEPDNG